jgi:hypothetical protein
MRENLREIRSLCEKNIHDPITNSADAIDLDRPMLIKFLNDNLKCIKVSSIYVCVY